MKVNFLDDTTIKLTNKGNKYIVKFNDGYANVTKYFKNVFIGNWTVYADGRYTLIAGIGDTDPRLDDYVRLGTVANLNNPKVKDAINKALKKGGN